MAPCHVPYLRIAPEARRSWNCQICVQSRHRMHSNSCPVCCCISHSAHKNVHPHIHQYLYKQEVTINQRADISFFLTLKAQTLLESPLHSVTAATFLDMFTSTRDVLTIPKHLHSCRGDKSLLTNTGVMWNCVKTAGSRSTDVFDFQTFINVWNKEKTFILEWN